MVCRRCRRWATEPVWHWDENVRSYYYLCSLCESTRLSLLDIDLVLALCDGNATERMVTSLFVKITQLRNEFLNEVDRVVAGGELSAELSARRLHFHIAVCRPDLLRLPHLVHLQYPGGGDYWSDSVDMSRTDASTGREPSDDSSSSSSVEGRRSGWGTMPTGARHSFLDPRPWWSQR